MTGDLQAAIARAQAAQARSQGYRDAATRYDPSDAAEPDCLHLPTRLYAWTAYDGTTCVCCCDCGAVLHGAADADVPL